MKKTVRRFVSEDTGATAIEYALIAALVSMTIIGMLGNMKNSLGAIFARVSNGLDTG